MIRNQITAAYRRLAAPVGRRYLRKKLAGGMPPQFSEPLSFLMAGRLSREDQAVVDKVESIRTRTAGRSDRYVFDQVPSEHGLIRMMNSTSALTSPPQMSLTRSASWVVNIASVSTEWGTFLYLCAQASRAGTILELGSCAGISGCYLASAQSCKRLITIEGSPSLAALARTNLCQVSENCLVINALFDEGLDQIVPTLNSGLDLIFIDGHHEKDATLHYFERLQPYLNLNSLVIFDDIHLYRGMWQAWQALCQWKGIASALNVGRFGLCLWGGGSEQPRVFDFSPFTGPWAIGNARTVNTDGLRSLP